MNVCFLLKAERATCAGGGSQAHAHYREGEGEPQKSVPFTSEQNHLVSQL